MAQTAGIRGLLANWSTTPAQLAVRGSDLEGLVHLMRKDTSCEEPEELVVVAGAPTSRTHLAAAARTAGCIAPVAHPAAHLHAVVCAHIAAAVCLADVVLQVGRADLAEVAGVAIVTDDADAVFVTAGVDTPVVVDVAVGGVLVLATAESVRIVVDSYCGGGSNDCGLPCAHLLASELWVLVWPDHGSCREQDRERLSGEKDSESAW